MIKRGNWINKIRSYLIGKGINDRFIKETITKIRMKILTKIFLQLKFVKKRLVQPELRIIDHYSIKKIFSLARNGLILKLQKLWI